MSEVLQHILELMDGGSGHPLPNSTPSQPLGGVGAVTSPRGDAYEGARDFDSLTLWRPELNSADMDILPSKPLADARVRDMVRNDAFVAGAASIHKDSIVGGIYLLNARPRTKVLFGKEDDVWEEEAQQELEEKFTLWAESPNNWMDAQRTKGLTAFVRLAVGVELASGEVLSSAEWMPDDGRPFRTAVQMLDNDRLCDPLFTRFGYNQKIRGGIEKDRYGAPIAYHIRNSHPTDFTVDQGWTTRRVMARKPWGRRQILHIYEQTRPEQTRGISEMVSALSELKMLRQFRAIELQRAVVAATYASSIESELPSGDILARLGGNEDGIVATYMREYLTAINEYAGGAKGLRIDGVKIPVFPPGTKLNMKTPGAASPDADKFEASRLRYLAAALGLSYEQLSRDYSQTNYASARASRGETLLHMNARKKRTADAVATFVYELWFEEAYNRNALETLKRKDRPDFYAPLMKEAYTAADWLGAGVPMIDPLKETQALILQMSESITSREMVIAKLHGTDWRKVAKQIGRERKTYADLGIDLTKNENKDMVNALSAAPTSDPENGEG